MGVKTAWEVGNIRAGTEVRMIMLRQMAMPAWAGGRALSR
jgi:hypothetical protein